MATLSSAIETQQRTESSPTSSSPLLALKPSTLKRKRPPHIEIPNVLQEIETDDNLRFQDLTTHQNDAVCFGGNGFGVVSRKGKKKFMEDSHRVVPCFSNCSNKSFFGVYDGHGGKKASEFVSENLHRNVLEMMKNCKEKEEALKAAYVKTDFDFLQEGVVSGSCCVTALIQDQEMIVSNLGDCRAVLCRKGGVAEALTADHRAGRDDERERIENQGGYVEFHRGAWRVHGILAVSRSIGDAHMKKWVVAEPETRILELKDDMEFLVLASDGLWDVVSNQEAVDTVLAHRKTPKDNNFIKGLVNVSPSSKLRRVSLIKQRKELSSIQSPKPAKPVSYNYHSENEPPSSSPYSEDETSSPPSKSRKITTLKRMKIKSESSWSKEACKELVNLAVSRGSMDDITVMIIDLNHYKS